MWPWPGMTGQPAVHWRSLSLVVVNLPSSGMAGYVALECRSQLATCKREGLCLGYLPRLSCASRMLLRQGLEAWNEESKKRETLQGLWQFIRPWLLAVSRGGSSKPVLDDVRLIDRREDGSLQHQRLRKNASFSGVRGQIQT